MHYDNVVHRKTTKKIICGHQPSISDIGEVCHSHSLARDTEVSAAVPPDYRTACVLILLSTDDDLLFMNPSISFCYTTML